MIAFILFLLCNFARADTFEEIQASGELLWGADQEGGGPYVYPRDDNPDLVTGFEYDLAEKLASYMKVKAVFTQGQWDRMPDMLSAKKVHLIMNGYELTPERMDLFDATVPYYVYALQMLVRKGDANFRTWDDLKKNHARVGVLTGSAAETTMRDFCGETACEVINYDGNTDSMQEVQTGKLDATLQDTPIAAFYAPSFEGLEPIGEPVAPGYYVIYVNKGETKLRDALNEALILSMRNGELERIYRTYGIWDKQQEQLAQILETGKFYGYHKAASVEVEKAEMPQQEEVQVSVRKRGWQVVEDYMGVLAQSAGLTILLSVTSFPLAIALGLLIAVGRLYGPVWLRAPLVAYVEFVRGTPLMLQLYFIFFVLPTMGIALPALATGIIGLAINYSAYEAEIYRAGLQAVPPGQMEAAQSLGMSRWQGIQRIVVPQAGRIVIPPVINDFIALFKDTSVCSVITLVELTKRFSVLSMSTQATLELMLMTAFLYLLMSYPTSLLARYVEKRLGGAS